MMLQKRKSVFGYVLLGLSIVCICGSARVVLAQVIHGSIYGQVTDATGAAVPNATLTVTDVSKGTSVQATTNESGEYTVQNLIPDVYNVKASATGFGTVEQPGIQVSANTSPKIDLKLTVGNASETVTVTTQPPQLQTDKAEVGAFLMKKRFPVCPYRIATLPAFNC
jgi:hypothetical protein